jgi:lysozyme family protein
MQLGGVALGLLAFIGLEAGPLVGNLLAATLAAGGVVLVLFFERRAPPEG